MNGNFVVSCVLEDKEMNEKLVDKFESELKHLPEGGLCRKVIKGKPYLYHYIKSQTEDGTYKQRYISKADDYLKTSLKRRHFIEKSLPFLLANIKAAEVFIEMYHPYYPSDIITTMPKVYNDLHYEELLDGVINDSTAWSKENYKKSELYPELLIHNTIGGVKVRSKSEAIIAGLLEMNNIPFRYEAALELGELTYYPDFTILKPRDNEIIYWEHFGMIDNDEYNLSMEQKMLAYRKHGILPWNQLITTFETEKGSIDARNIQNIIKAFIL